MSFNISSLVLGIFVGFHIIFCYKYTHKGIKRYTQITCTDHLYSLFSPPDDVCHKSWRCRDLLGVTTNRRNGTNVTSVRSTAFREKNTDQHARNTEWSQINVNQHDHIIYIYILLQYLQIYFRQNIARFAKPAFNWRIARWYFFHSIIKHKKTWTETTDVSSKSILICFIDNKNILAMHYESRTKCSGNIGFFLQPQRVVDPHAVFTKRIKMHCKIYKNGFKVKCYIWIP